MYVTKMKKKKASSKWIDIYIVQIDKHSEEREK